METVDDAYNPVYVITGSVLIGGLLLWYYITERNDRRKYPVGLFYQPTPLHQHIARSCPSLFTQCRPFFLFGNGHLQSILYSFLKPVQVKARREMIELEDGGVIALDWVEENPEFSEDTPIIIVLPTLTGDLQSCSRFCKMAVGRGFRCVVFNKRGHGNTELKSPKLQGIGETGDLRQSVKHVHNEFPKADLTLVGSSAGSALMVSYLGVHETCPLIKAGVAISPGYDLVDLFSKELSKLYELVLLFNLKKILKQHEEKLKHIVNTKMALDSWNFTNYDYHVYCQFGGQESAMQYWRENNPMRNFDKVDVPVLCINGLDDPVCVKKNIPYDKLENNRNFMLLVSAKGGHCGFLEGWNLTSWSDRAAIDYIESVLDFRRENDSELKN